MRIIFALLPALLLAPPCSASERDARAALALARAVQHCDCPAGGPCACERCTCPGCACAACETNYERAQADALRTGKPLVVFVGGTQPVYSPDWITCRVPTVAWGAERMTSGMLVCTANNGTLWNNSYGESEATAQRIRSKLAGLRQWFAPPPPAPVSAAPLFQSMQASGTVCRT